MATNEVESRGVLWEQAFGYVQAVKHGNTIRMAGQFFHDSAGLVASARVDEHGQATDYSAKEDVA
ncbi:hypothetical protein [Mycolicibacterium iranicum]|nr:hypothetical protein [Mycolicibacterium iranicum]